LQEIVRSSPILPEKARLGQPVEFSAIRYVFPALIVTQ
jgi:hypothetical protein